MPLRTKAIAVLNFIDIQFGEMLFNMPILNIQPVITTTPATLTTRDNTLVVLVLFSVIIFCCEHPTLLTIIALKLFCSLYYNYNLLSMENNLT
jgi:hypothetical protein